VYVFLYLDDGEEIVDNIQGISSKHVLDLRTIFNGGEARVMQLTLESISWVPRAQYLLINSVYELESQALDALKAKLNLPIYPVGPSIPYFELKDNYCVTAGSDSTNYFQWLDSQPTGSVLYVSLGSFFSISSKQMDEIASGLRNSGVRYLWVSRGEALRLKESCGEKGIVVPWCDQLQVLCHSSVGGFWTHCGWNSSLEAVFAGIPMLALPLFFDQVPNSKQIVENLRIGWQMKKGEGIKILVKGEEITALVRRFMDTENSEGKDMRRRAKMLQQLCGQAIAKDGSSDKNLDAFIRDIS